MLKRKIYNHKMFFQEKKIYYAIINRSEYNPEWITDGLIRERYFQK